VFERIIDLIANGWERISPLVVVYAYEQGVVLRFGKYHRTIDAGLRWKIPFAEEVSQVTTAVTTLRLPPQTLTTADDHSVVVSAIVKYRIADPRPYVTDIWDQVDVLADVTMGAIRSTTVGATWEELRTKPPEQAVLAEVRKQANRYGFKIEAVTFVDLGRVRSLRFMTNNIPLNLDN